MTDTPETREARPSADEVRAALERMVHIIESTGVRISCDEYHQLCAARAVLAKLDPEPPR
jgi:hypothetical protein